MKRNAVTLVELLIVIAILGILIAVAVPLISFRDQGREQREASRIITAFIVKAQADAAESQRPCGIWIERSKPGESFDVFFARTPPNYSGDTENATCQVDGGGILRTETVYPSDPFTPEIWTFKDYPPNRVGTCTFGNNAMLVPVVVKPGDEIQIGHKGPWRRILSVSAGPPAQLTFIHSTAPQVDGVFPFVIRRQPEKAEAGGASLPTPACIDLTVSGSGYNPTAFNGTGPVVVMFNPQGEFNTAYWGNANKRLEATGGIHLLVGRSDKVNAAAPGAADANLNDGKAIWVTISTRAGGVHTTENIPWSDTLAPGDAISAKLSCSRQLINQ